MSTAKPTFPLPRSQAIELYFMEHRAKLLDIAAFLDRVDRAEDDLAGREDHRMEAFHNALEALRDAGPDRARRVQEIFSDPTTDPIPAAPGKGASGAWPGEQ